MILDKKTAKELETLLHPDVEEAIIKLLDYILLNESHILINAEAKIEELKLYQGKFLALSDLKQYKQRINDAIKNG